MMLRIAVIRSASQTALLVDLLAVAHGLTNGVPLLGTYDIQVPGHDLLYICYGMLLH
jgi:hypothetical protein